MTRRSASNRKSQSNGSYSKSNCCPVLPEGLMGEDLGRGLISAPRVRPARRRLLSICPPACGDVPCFTLKNHLDAAGSPGFSRRGIELAGADGQPRSIPRARDRASHPRSADAVRNPRPLECLPHLIGLGEMTGPLPRQSQGWR